MRTPTMFRHSAAPYSSKNKKALPPFIFAEAFGSVMERNYKPTLQPINQASLNVSFLVIPKSIIQPTGFKIKVPRKKCKHPLSHCISGSLTGEKCFLQTYKD